MSETNVLIFALLGGIVPALFWLWFWIRQDRLKPEPKSALFSSFLGGIIAVFLALFLELIFYYILVDANQNNLKDFPNILSVILENLTIKYDLIAIQDSFWNGIQNFLNNFDFSYIYNIDIRRLTLVVIIAPIIEETLKLLLTYNICLRRKVNDEPIDASIYLLTAALGFAAIETTLFITEPLSRGHIIDGLLAGNFRSIGPMLIHLISSAIIGIFLGLAFYKTRIKKFLYAITGLVISIIMHGIFNFFIMLNENTHRMIFFWIACLSTWILIFVLLALFQKVKGVVRKF